MSRNKVYFCLFVSPLLLFVFSFFFHQVSKANTVGSGVVISQIQVGGSDAKQEFVELYNPTDASIEMSGWRLTKKTSGLGNESNLVASLSGTIPSHGYFLIAHPNYSNPSVVPDAVYSSASYSIADDNTVILYNGDVERVVIDKVGFGNGTVADFETAKFGANPVAGGALLRKASQGSTVESMVGEEATGGNGYDSDNNAGDFVLEEISAPRNTQSLVASPVLSVGITLAPTLVQPSVAPTDVPTPTLISVPTATPTSEPTSTPTSVPTFIPTVMPTEVLSPTPTVILPTVTSMPKSVHGEKDHRDFRKFHFSYRIYHKKVSFFGRHVSIPFINCSFR